MSTFILGSGAIALYLLGWAAYVMELCNKGRVKIPLIQVMTGLGIILHGITTFGLLLNSGGLDLSLLKILSLLALVINGLVFLSSLKESIHSLYLALISSSTKTTAIIPYSLQAHILTSIVAYSFLAIAALQALLAGYQNWQLKHKHQNALMRTLPALETMEKLLFKLIWVGEILLTASLITGFYVYSDFFAQQLIHKVTFSIVAWLVYAVLIFGRHHYGWRGQRAINWTWVGFSAILLGYVGSKFVIEFILS